MLKSLSIARDFFNLFIPDKCGNCGTSLHDFEEYICKSCLNKIPKTNFYKEKGNIVSQVFWGRVELEYAFACYFFSKDSILQRLIHQVKYKGAKELAFTLGKEMGFDLIDSSFYKNVDLIIPVPLHPKKEKRRGYNQSDCLARGLAESLKKPYSKDVLKRVQYTSTQTKKTREQRWENVKNAFMIRKNIVENKHVVIVDDVLTTGATLEACATKLLECKNTKVSVITLAYASD